MANIRTKWITSWEGFEHLRERIHHLAIEVRDSDILVRQQYPSSVATGLICQSMRDSSIQANAFIKRAADAQNALNKLHHECVWEHGLDFDLVYNVWVVILDPNAQLLPVTGR